MLTVIFVTLLIFLSAILACLCSIREKIIEMNIRIERCQRILYIIRMSMLTALKKGDNEDET